MLHIMQVILPQNSTVQQIMLKNLVTSSEWDNLQARFCKKLKLQLSLRGIKSLRSFPSIALCIPTVHNFTRN